MATTRDYRVQVFLSEKSEKKNTECVHGSLYYQLKQSTIKGISLKKINFCMV